MEMTGIARSIMYKTFAPIEKDLINFKLLNKKEKKYLNEYHKKIYMILGSYLNKDEKSWLRSFIN